MTTKKCNKCKCIKELSEFNKDSRTKDGKGCVCKACLKVYRAKHKSRIAACQKEYCEKHKGKLAEYHKEYYEDHKEKIAEYSRNYKEINRENLIIKRKIYTEDNKEQITVNKKIYYENNKELFKVRHKIYYENHKKEHAIYQKIYRINNSEKVKKGQRNCQARRKGWGKPIALNQYFKNSHFHHLHIIDSETQEIDRQIGIFIPAKLHRSVNHSHKRRKSMLKINTLAFNFLYTQIEN